MAKVKWLEKPEAHDFPAAADYLALLADTDSVKQLINGLQSAAIVRKKAKDILRAAQLALLPQDNPHVAADLSVSLHLGLEARHTIRIPPKWQSGAAQIGVVSGTSYLSVPQGEPVADIVVAGEDGREATLTLRNGVTTARTDYDFYAPEEMNHRKIRIAESTPATRLSKQDTPFQLHKYAATLDVPASIERIESLTFVCTGEMVLDIWDVALIPGEGVDW